MLEAIELIEKHAAVDGETFRQDELIQTWMVHHLQIIGEAARTMPQTFYDQYPAVPWTKIIGMRHVLVHDYFKIDLGIVWRVVKQELPNLKRQIEAILHTLEQR